MDLSLLSNSTSLRASWCFSFGVAFYFLEQAIKFHYLFASQIIWRNQKQREEKRRRASKVKEETERREDTYFSHSTNFCKFNARALE